MVGRRYVIQAGLAAAAALALAQLRISALAQVSYPRTREILGRSRQTEVNAYRQYAAFTRQATTDGYPGIAYLFAALAAAELIHGQNFERILARLGVEIRPLAERAAEVESTRQNLIKAAADELDSVYTFYPGILRDLQPEGLQDAITMTTYAWETEKQHLDILKSIQRWTPKHFEAVARKIENETAQYFVCQICGATMVRMAQGKCPICRIAADNIRRIEPPI
jgi:rubrerythrin